MSRSAFLHPRPPDLLQGSGIQLVIVARVARRARVSLAHARVIAELAGLGSQRSGEPVHDAIGDGNSPLFGPAVPWGRT